MKQKICLLVGVLIGALLIGACSKKDEPQIAGSGSSGQSDQSNGRVGAEDLADPLDLGNPEAVLQTSPLDGVEPLADGTRALPPIAGIDGGLLVTVDEVLVYARFDGEPATLIHTDMTPFTVEALPNRRVAFIGRQSDGGRRDSAYVFNLDSNEFEAEYPLDASGAIIGWSDDGQWLTIGEFQNNSQAIVVSADGSFRSEAITYGFDMAWLTDNTAIFMARDPDDGSSAYALRHYDPTTDTFTDLDIPITEDFNLTVATYEVELADLGYIISDHYLLFDRFDENETERWFLPLPEALAANNQAVCATWDITRLNREDGTTDVVRQVQDTHRLSDLNLLPDGSALVIRWFRDDCTLSNALEAELLRISPDGDSTVVLDNILVDTNSIQNFGQERRYTVSPDGQFVVWVSQEGSTLQNPAVDMIDLATGSRLRLFTREAMDRTVIRSVTWVE